jgi:hypothetical protein
MKTTERGTESQTFHVSRRGLLILGVVLGLSSSALGPQATSRAQQSESAPSVDMVSGQVTAKRGQSIEINGREYMLNRNVVIKDEEGRPRELKDFEQGTEVRFHLKQERIDQLVLILAK